MIGEPLPTRKMELNLGQKHILRLTKRDAGLDGWAKVSKQLFPHIQDLPKDLVELKETDDGGFIRLTERGHAVVDYI